jgi:lipoprotein-anchoring transpeptidase ErfK/SrfK
MAPPSTPLRAAVGRRRRGPAPVAVAALVVGLWSLLVVGVTGPPAGADEPPEAQQAAQGTEAPSPNTVTAYGAAPDLGPADGIPFAAALSGIAARPDGDGYWLVAADGGIFTYGDADFHGSMGGRALNQPIVGMAAHPDGDGYWLVAADGGIFTFGDADFHGSEGGSDLDFPVVGMAASPTGDGYWLVGRGGQVHPHGVTDHGNAAEHERGPAVEAVQRRLTELGYWLGPTDGVYGQLTEQAVYAFQKYEGLPVDGEVDAETRLALAAASRPSARTGSGDVIEIDKARQLLLFVEDGRVRWVFNTSTGTEEPYTYEGTTYLADTPPGRWEIYRQVDGWRTSNLGRLYRPKYFHTDGIAIHGYSRVPSEPASHGCVRVTNPAIDHIWAEDLAPIGSDVWVYGEAPDV